MKKSIFIFILLLSTYCYSQTTIVSSENLSQIFDVHLYNGNSFSSKPTKKQLLEDFDAFVYYFSTSYIGYDNIVNKGFNIEKFISNYRNKIIYDEIKTPDDLLNSIYSELKDYILDAHFSFANNNSVYNFIPQNKITTKTEFSNKPCIKETSKSIYLSLPIFLPDYFAMKTENSKFFEEVLSKYKTIKNKKNIIIDLRNCEGGLNDYPLLLLYSLYKGENKIIPSNIYSARNLQSELLYNNTKSIKTPVTESIKYQFFVKNGNNKLADEYLTSSVMQKENPRRIVFVFNSKSDIKLEKSTFKGKIFFLTSNKTASAAESLILISQKLFPSKVYVLGLNTKGCLTYIDVHQFVSPNNSFGFSMSFSSIEENLKKFDSWKGEGIGIQPDIFCDDKDLPQIIKNLAKDKHLSF